jgi:hypothetical protein
MLVLWKNDSNVALWRNTGRWNVSHCLFRVQPKRLPTKRTVDCSMAMGRLDIGDWFYDWYAPCCSRFRRSLTPAVCLQLGSNFEFPSQDYFSYKLHSLECICSPLKISRKLFVFSCIRILVSHALCQLKKFELCAINFSSLRLVGKSGIP